MLAARAEAADIDPDMRKTLLSLLRRGKRLSAAEVAGELPRTVSISGAVALFQRWVWDYFSFRLGGPVRYYPGEAQVFEALARDWSLQAAAGWTDRLRQLRSVAEHPLNARAAVEGALLEFAASMATDETNGNGQP